MERRWAQVRRIFEEAIEIQDSSERAEFVSKACGDDVSLRGEVESLLKSSGSASERFKPLGSALFEGFVSEIADEQLVGIRIGSYEIFERIAAGGMGTVYKARRIEGDYDRPVAIKIIRPGHHSPRQLRQFQREIQALARLDHPNIARLWDGGTTPDGLPYLVLEYVDGVPIDRYCQERGLPTEQRLRLFTDTCAAVQFAHAHLIVHRDLKPRNILVTKDGRVKLLDFGIAKLLGDDSGEATETLLRVMTPQYASPEQIRGEPVSTASDVYSLGVILYELLCGQRPYDVAGVDGETARRLVCDTEPPTPSSAVASHTTNAHVVAASTDQARVTRPSNLTRQLRGDVDTIVMTAMHKDQARRYASAERLSEDIDRYQRGLPIRARRDTFGYRARKFVSRNRGLCIVATFAAIAVAAGTAGTFAGLIRANSLRRTAEAHLARAQAESKKATAVSEFLKEMLAAPSPDQRGRDILVRDLLDKAAQQLSEGKIEDLHATADLHHALAVAHTGLGNYEKAVGHAERSLAACRAIEGDNSMAVAEALGWLGGIHERLGNLREAERLHRESLGILESTGTPQELAAGLNRLACTLDTMEQYDEAEELHRKALAIREKLKPAAEHDIAVSKNNLANLLTGKGDLRSAGPLYDEALAIFRRLYGNEHPATSSAIYSLGSYYRQIGKHQEAVALFGEALSLDEKLLGELHPDLAATLDSFAGVLGDLGRLQEAESASRRALVIRETSLGPGHPDIAVSLNNLATYLERSKKYVEAKGLYERALALRIDVFGPRSRPVGDSLNNLAGLAFATGQLDEAVTGFVESLAIYKEVLPAGHPRIANALNNLGHVYLEANQYDAAIIVAAESVDVHRQIGNPRLLATALRLLGRCQAALRKFDEGEKSARESLSIWRAQLEAGHWGLAETEALLGYCLVGQSRFEEAEPILARSLAVLKKNFGEHDPRVRNVTGHLVALYEGWGRPELAKQHRDLLEGPFGEEDGDVSPAGPS